METAFLMLAFLVLILSQSTSQQIPDRCIDICDPLVVGFKPTLCGACFMNVTPEEYCLGLFASGAQPNSDGVCNPYYTKRPSKPPTLRPSRRPTEYYFPSQSPQSLQELDDYRVAHGGSRTPTFQPASQPGIAPNGQPSMITPPPMIQPQGGSNNAVAVGLGVGLGMVFLLFVCACVVRRRRRNRGNSGDSFGALPQRQQEQEKVVLT